MNKLVYMTSLRPFEETIFNQQFEISEMSLCVW